ncbi:MAG: DUF4830 domain-containing protein [Ruminococcus sp.]|nr:DUF4830 domain-containing protein [Ruminococcus sp.]
MSKKFVTAAIVIAIILGAIVIIFPDNKQQPTAVPESTPVDASSTDRRISYFASHGWEAEEISHKNIKIPEEFSTSYEQYVEFQDNQGMPLREYAGRDAEIYVYEVKNYSPDNQKLFAELLVCDNTAIASIIYSEKDNSLRLAVN